MRYRALGITRSYDFNSVIIGTSMLEKTSSKEANDVFDDA
jgi:hypothetical protein